MCVLLPTETEKENICTLVYVYFHRFFWRKNSYALKLMITFIAVD